MLSFWPVLMKFSITLARFCRSTNKRNISLALPTNDPDISDVALVIVKGSNPNSFDHALQQYLLVESLI